MKTRKLRRALLTVSLALLLTSVIQLAVSADDNNPNKFNRLMTPMSERNPPPAEDGIHDPENSVGRLDRTQAGDKTVDLPCTGVFEMEDGKIKVWRDYFDLGTYVKGMS